MSKLEVGQCVDCHLIYPSDKLQLVSSGAGFVKDFEIDPPRYNWRLQEYTVTLCDECIGRIELRN